MNSLETLSVKQKNDLAITAVNRFLMPFCIAIDPKYTTSWFHESVALKLEEALKKVLEGKPARIILEVPPRHGKSELATIKFPAWVLGKHPEMPIIVSAYSADLAEKFGQKTRDIMQDEVYKKLFNTRLRADTQAKGNWLTDKGGGYTATGIGGSITGKGFKIGIIDDPFKNREEGDSEKERENKWQWYTSTFYTRQEGISAIIVIATRWHLDDLIGRLKQQEENARKAGLVEFDNWEVIRYPAIAEEDELHRKKGEALWPEKFDIKILENIKNTIGVYDWASLYQQDPILAENAEFKKDWFKYFEESDLRGKELIYKTTIDLAISKDKEADNTVIRTVAKEKDKPYWYLIEEIAGHLDPLQTIDAIFKHYLTYRSEIWLETNAYQKALKYFIEEEQRKREEYFFVNELKRNTNQNKEMRIRGLIPLYKAGIVFHRKSDTELERELLQFPKGKHDDRIDALASMLEAIENTPRSKNKIKQPTFHPTNEYDLSTINPNAGSSIFMEDMI